MLEGRSHMFPWSGHSTFKPHKKVPDGKQGEMLRYVAATLGSGNLKLAVKLPEGDDLNEWLAANSLSPALRTRTNKSKQSKTKSSKQRTQPSTSSTPSTSCTAC